ncbi:hypothetical protein TH53_15810 [Pedobacter lusitanus]|uniref:Contig66, whole genome shotgun sequence n=1 Tax=Pedobacter lusitanus TaxID=1503925 RepID=A0A0D0GGB6_9SPHI|nr:hypothetical protein [Pedobacter lusitanus]KIO76312.1 hypothetical protein TH53_15810 [Pedobacter lusitanus]
MNIKTIGICIISTVAFTFSCKKNDEVVKPPVVPENTTNLHVRLNSKKIITFQRVLSSGISDMLKETEIETHFGDRVSFFIPQEIIVKNDSTTLVKLYGVMEKFKSRWDKQKLYFQAGSSDNWELLGEKSGPAGFLINSSFYKKKSTPVSSGSLILGQQYNLKSYEKIMNKDAGKSTLIWLNVESFYK